MKYTRILKAATILSAVIVAPAPSPSATPAPELKSWDLWVGDWTLAGTAKDSPTEPEYQVTWRLQGKRILGGCFIQVDSIWKGNGAEQRWLEILSYDPVKRTHACIGYASNGMTWVIAATFKGATFLEDGTTTTPDGKTIKWRNTWVISADRTAVSGIQVSEQDGTRWTSFTVKGTKAAPSAPPVVEGKVSVDGIDRPYVTSSASSRQTGNTQTATVDTPEVGSVAVNPFTLRYRIEGSGPPALIVGSSQYYPRTFSSALRRSLRLVFLDNRGFAPPPAHPVDTSAYALDVLLEDIERARAQLKLGRVIVIGHSGNSYLALEYAKKYPQHVTHVVMIAISPDLSAAHARAQREYFETAASPERKEALRRNRAELPDSELAKRSPRQRYIDGYVRESPRVWYDLNFDIRPIWVDLDVNVDMTTYVWGQIFRDIDITKGLDRFDRPVLLMLGRHDFLLAAPAIWDPVMPKFRDLTVRIFDRSGHTPQYEEAASFDTALLKWLRSRP